MLKIRRLPLRYVVFSFGFVALIAVPWALLIYAAYAGGLTMLRIPFLPIATMGTAVAFYVGFKNNSAYDRFWEGRKIWGGIVNASRTWAASVLAYVEPGEEHEQAIAMRRELVLRHLAWVNSLRVQLRANSRFFHKPARGTKRRLEKHAEHMRNDWAAEIGPYVPAEELDFLQERANAATHLLARQSLRLAELVQEGRLDMFRQLELMGCIEEFYALQGKCERIKNTPFPRQYAETGRLFTRVFVTLVPLGLLDVFGDHVGAASGALDTLNALVPMVVASALLSWVFITMEAIGDASEDPFERSMNDVPMNALCRAIEIDLLELLGDSELPEREQAVDGVLY